MNNIFLRWICLVLLGLYLILFAVFQMSNAGAASLITSSEGIQSTISIIRSKLKLISYNIDGLNDHEVVYRTRVILGMILSQLPDVIQLQEVILQSYGILRPVLESNGYVCSGISDDFGHYFTMTAIKKSRFSNYRFSFDEFQGKAMSRQGRYLLKTQAKLDGAHDVLFLNCHLESTGAAFKSLESTARVAQLQQGLRLISNHAATGPALLSGDLNIRDPEAGYVFKSFPIGNGSEDSKILDVAKSLQTAKTLPHTWFMPGNPKVSCRYDRVYIHNPQFPNIFPFVPQSIEVIGNDEILDENAPYLTPSDHRGLVVVFSLPESEESQIESSKSNENMHLRDNHRNKENTERSKKRKLDESTALESQTSKSQRTHYPEIIDLT